MALYDVYLRISYKADVKKCTQEFKHFQIYMKLNMWQQIEAQKWLQRKLCLQDNKENSEENNQYITEKMVSNTRKNQTSITASLL